MRKTLALLALSWPYALGALAQAPDSATPEPPSGALEESAPLSARSAPPQPEAEASSEAASAASSEAEAAPPLSLGELEALGFGTAGGGTKVSAVDTDLHLSGFVDFSMWKLIASKDSQVYGFFPNRTSFYVGNFNLYLTKNLSESFRTMGEVRFLYKPNGDIPIVDGIGTPTTTSADPADFDRPLRWGGIEIERVYLEWSAHRFLTIRAGQYLTPYGVWNVDHGSPTFIPVQRPYVIGEGLFPERQTGFELFGRWDATSNGTLGYHLTLSNGQGPISEYRDLDENKAIGGRLYWEQHNIGPLRIGVSAYYGRDTDAVTTLGLTSSGRLRPVDRVFRQFDVLSLAADVVWRYRGLLLQAEWISRQRVYTERGRAAVFNDLTQRTILPADGLEWGAYGLIGYRLPWFGIMPYYVAQYLDSTTLNGVRTEITNMQVGLNIRPYDFVVFKVEYSHAFFTRKLFGSDDPIRFFQAQVAWAF